MFLISCATRSDLDKGDTHSICALLYVKVKETGVIINDGGILAEEKLAQHQVVVRVIPIVQLLHVCLYRVVQRLLQQEGHPTRHPPVMSAEEPVGDIGLCGPRVHQNLKSLMGVVSAGAWSAGVLVCAEVFFGGVVVARGIVLAEGNVVLAGVVVAAPYKNIMISWKMGLGRGEGGGKIQSRLLPGEGLYCFAFPKSCVV